jgi:acyl-CoA synthetase (NDP forming)
MTQSLDKLFKPRAIAIIGATQDPRRPGGQALKSLSTLGYAGEVYAVNPRYRDIEGRACYASVDELPVACELAVIGVPAAQVPSAIEACGRNGIPYVVILSAGFREIGERGAVLEARLQAALKASGVRAVGPNCIGMMSLRNRVFAGFGAAFRKTDWRGGPMAMISQSGGFAYSIMTFCEEAGIGFDHMVSTGNESSLGALDFIEHFLEDEGTQLIAVYMEGIADGKRLRALGRRALAVGKPIAVWKVGNTRSGQRAAVSHTANLTDDYDWYRDAFREGGFIEVHEIYDLIDCARAFRGGKRPRGNRCAVVTTSGGAGVLLTDACERYGLALPSLTDATKSRLNTVLPDFASLANPVDVTAAVAQKEMEFSTAQQAVLDDPHVDMLIVRSYPGHDAVVWADHLITAAHATGKPILISLTGTVRESAAWLPRLEAAGIPAFEAPSRLVYAASALHEFEQRRARAAAASRAVRPCAAQSLPEVGGEWDEVQGKVLLQQYGIATPQRLILTDAAALETAAWDLSFPVALKVVSADIAHKTELGGVKAGITSLPQLKHELAAMMSRVRAAKPDARVRGWLVEEMASGVEVIAGALNNASFGPVILVGLGGVQAEILKDVVRAYAPVSADEARRLILQLKGTNLLCGFRGQPACDLDALADAISRLSWLITDHTDALSEIEINPILAGPHGAVAVDAMIRPRSS